MIKRKRLRVESPKQEVEMMLDSGAFAAWSKGNDVSIDDYIEYIQDHLDVIETYINLDVIPGRLGKTTTPNDIEEAASKSWDNLKYMEDRGLSPMPVFHFGERLYWLERMLGEGYDYIGLGGLARGKGPEVRQNWLDKIFTKLTTSDGHPIIKTHGFGLTAVSLLFRYPWYSCDSTSWMLEPAYGGIFVPPYVNGEFDYTVTPITLKISSSYPKTGLSKHYNSFGPSEQARIRYFCEDEMGVDFKDAQDHFTHRTLICAKYFKRVGDEKKEAIFKHRAEGLFQ
jgi:hypothetical protein